MRRRAVVSFLVTWSVLVLIFSARGHGQPQPGPPPLGQSAIDRGLVERVYGSPDSPETKMRVDDIVTAKADAFGALKRVTSPKWRGQIPRRDSLNPGATHDPFPSSYKTDRASENDIQGLRVVM